MITVDFKNLLKVKPKPEIYLSVDIFFTYKGIFYYGNYHVNKCLYIYGNRRGVCGSLFGTIEKHKWPQLPYVEPEEILWCYPNEVKVKK